jgi:hypothetical protein
MFSLLKKEQKKVKVKEVKKEEDDSEFDIDCIRIKAYLKDVYKYTKDKDFESSILKLRWIRAFIEIKYIINFKKNKCNLNRR